MELRFLKGDKCPICGTHVVVQESVEVDRYGKEPKVREHVHGGKWEHRKFICGLVLSYCPNFRRTEINKLYRCQNDPKLIERNKKREEAKQEVLKFISQYEDVDEDFKNRMYEEVKRIYVE